MFNLIKPKYFIPIHGEYRHLMQHKELALEMGIGESNIFIPAIGNSIEIDKGGIKKAQEVPSGRLFVDKNKLLGDCEELMKERKIMASDGAVTVIAKITLTNGYVTEPIIISHGIDIGEKLTEEIKNDIASTIASGDMEEAGAEEARIRIKKSVAKKLQKRLSRRPIITVVAEV